MKAWLLKPLGMASSGFDYDEFTRARLAVGSDQGKPALIEDLGYTALVLIVIVC